ncbi:MAG: DUF4145 domain-containing protein [Candidatus Binatus sp.]
MDYDKGEAHMGDAPFKAYYPLFGETYGVALCDECSNEYVVIISGPPRIVWPLPGVEVPKQIPGEVSRPLIEAKKAHGVSAETAALLAARTALVRMQRQQKISKIDDLIEQGVITPVLAGQAHEVRLWANATGHEDLTTDPSGDDVEHLIAYIDLLFETIYVHPERLAALKKKRGKMKGE